MAGEKPKKRHIRWPCQRRWDPLRARWPARRPRCHGFEPQELVLVTKKLKASAEREYWKLICDQFQIIWKTLAFSSCVNNTRLANYLFFILPKMHFYSFSSSCSWQSRTPASGHPRRPGRPRRQRKPSRNSGLGGLSGLWGPSKPCLGQVRNDTNTCWANCLIPSFNPRVLSRLVNRDVCFYVLSLSDKP